jgi:calcium-dependent protein kinase
VALSVFGMHDLYLLFIDLFRSAHNPCFRPSLSFTLSQPTPPPTVIISLPTQYNVAKTVAEMLSAVSFLHSRHICHRDLKLENWVLESGKDVWSPLKLIDFGLSTHYTPGHRLSRVVGSSYYVAPEVLKKSYTEACDLWSLGVIVYMLLSGAPPFYGRNDEAIKASIVHGQYQFPHELFRDVSDDAMAFVSCLLSYSIEYRYTAEQALTHPWLRSNCDPEMLQRAKDGARGVVSVSDGYDINAMQMG